jgi:methionyl-tRNA formyltransferase
MRHLTSLQNIPLYVVDSPGEEIFENLESPGEFDFLLSLSWRFLIPKKILSKARLASINLHRGLLPRYAGAEPVRRMLEDGLKQATITAHIMEEIVDSGEILSEAHLPMEILAGESIPQAVSRIKNELDPLYPSVAFDAVQKVLKSRGLPNLEGA